MLSKNKHHDKNFVWSTCWKKFNSNQKLSDESKIYLYIDLSKPGLWIALQRDGGSTINTKQWKQTVHGITCRGWKKHEESWQLLYSNRNNKNKTIPWHHESKLTEHENSCTKTIRKKISLQLWLKTLYGVCRPDFQGETVLQPGTQDS